MAHIISETQPALANLRDWWEKPSTGEIKRYDGASWIALGGSSGVPVATAAGTADAITASYTPALTLADMTLCAFIASGANTVVNPTFKPDTSAAHTITKQGGLPLVPGDIPGAFAVCLLEYSLANTRWELLNPKGSTYTYPIAIAAGTVDAITANFTPDLTLSDMVMCAIIASGANTIANPTFAPDGLAAHTITKRGGVALVAGDVPGALAVCFLEYNLANTRWELLNPQGIHDTAVDGVTTTPVSSNWAFDHNAADVVKADTSLVGAGFFLDEDDMVSDSAIKVPSQQSVKAYADSLSGGVLTAASAWIVASDASAAMLAAAAILKAQWGDLVQICDGIEHEIIINNCDVAWDSEQGTNVLTSTSSATPSPHGGTYATFHIEDAVGTTSLLASDVISVDLSGHTCIKFYIRSSVALAYGDLKLQFDDQAHCASPIETFIIPAIAQDTWTLLTVNITNPAAAGWDTTISIGLYMQTDIGHKDIWLDDIRQAYGDEENINTALAALPASAGAVEFSGGTFVIATPFDAVANITIRGQGRATKFSGASTVPIIHIDSVANVTLKNIWFCGAGASDVPKYGASGIVALIWADGTASEVTVEDCIISDSGVGVLFDGGTTICKSIRNTFQDIGANDGSQPGYGILTLAHGCLIQGNNFSAVKRHPVYVTSSASTSASDMVIRDNVMSGTVGDYSYPIHIFNSHVDWPMIERIIVQANIITDCVQGIYVGGYCNDISLIGNKLDNITYYGIFSEGLQNSTAIYPQNVTISENTVNGASYGIYLLNGKNVKVAKNILVGITTYGIYAQITGIDQTYVSNFLDYIQFTGNTIQGNGTYGLRIGYDYSWIRGVYVDGNTISGFTTNYSPSVAGVPTAGWYVRGDKFWELAPTANAAVGWTCTSRVDTTIRVEAATAATTIDVTSTSGILAGDYIGIVLDNIVIHWTTVTFITDADTLEITTGIPAGRHADVGAAIYTFRWQILSTTSTNTIDQFFDTLAQKKAFLFDFSTYDMFNTYKNGTGNYAQGMGLASVETGSTAGSSSRQSLKAQETVLYGCRWQTRLNLTPVTGNTLAFVGVVYGVELTETQTTKAMTTKHVGIFYDDGKWYASVADGGTQNGNTEIPALIGASGVLVIDTRVSGVADFYWTGVRVAHLTSNIPSGAGNYGYMNWYVYNKATTTASTLYFLNYYYVVD